MSDSSNNDPIASIFNIVPNNQSIGTSSSVEPYVDEAVANNTTDENFEYAQRNLQSIIEQGKEALGEMIMIAKASESPRAFEVAANLLKTLSDINAQLIDTTLKKHALDPNNVNQGPSTVNNNLFLSTADLLKMIKATPDAD